MIRISKQLLMLASLASTLCCQAQSEITPVSQVTGTGPYPATAATTPAMPGNTLYMPVESGSIKLPVVLWGNGGCMDNGLAYGRFLREVASHGFFIIAAGEPLEEGKSALERAREAQSGPRQSSGHTLGEPDKTTAEQLIAGLDWLTEASERADHPLYQRIDTDHVAVMGHSCGGIQALQIATDPRLDTAIIFNSGVINEPMKVQSTALKVRHDVLQKITVPMAYINGGPSDIAYFNALDDIEKLRHIPLMFAENGVGHGGTFTAPNGGAYGVLAVKWLKTWLKGDADTGRWFKGKNCLLCEDFDWQVQRHGLGE